MLRQAPLHLSIMIIVLVAATATACTTGSAPRMVGTGDVVADRQRVMKLQGEQMTDIQNKIKADNIEGIATNAEVLAITSMQITSLFPEGSLTDKSSVSCHDTFRKPLPRS